MKVKNIMFFGFAAAILSMGAANAAATATFSPAVSGANEAGRKIVSSKAYVDSVASNIAGQLKSVAVTGSYTDLDNKPTLPTAAQSGTHITTSTDANNVITVNVSDITDAGTGIDSTDTGLTTGKAVYEYVHSNPEGYATATDMANHKQVPAKPSSCTNADPCVLMETADGYGWFHMATDVAASQTGTQQASASLTTNVAEQ